MDVARELIDDGYNAQKYRDAYGDLNLCIRPPSVENLESDPTLLPSMPVTNKSGPQGEADEEARRLSGGGTHLLALQRADVRPGTGGGGGGSGGAGAVPANSLAAVVGMRREGG